MDWCLVKHRNNYIFTIILRAICHFLSKGLLLRPPLTSLLMNYCIFNMTVIVDINKAMKNYCFK